MSDWHSMDTDQVVKELNSNLHQGLSITEARNRLDTHGHNELQEEEESYSPIWSTKNILIMILLLAFVLSFITVLFRISIPAFFWQ